MLDVDDENDDRDDDRLGGDSMMTTYIAYHVISYHSIRAYVHTYITYHHRIYHSIS